MLRELFDAAGEFNAARVVLLSSWPGWLIVLVALAVNRVIFGNRAVFIWSREGRRLAAAEA